MPSPEGESERKSPFLYIVDAYYRIKHIFVNPFSREYLKATSELDREFDSRVDQAQTESELYAAVAWHRAQTVELQADQMLQVPPERLDRILASFEKKVVEERRLFESTGDDSHRDAADMFARVVVRVREKRAEAKLNIPDPPSAA